MQIKFTLKPEPHQEADIITLLFFDEDIEIVMETSRIELAQAYLSEKVAPSEMGETHDTIEKIQETLSSCGELKAMWYALAWAMSTIEEYDYLEVEEVFGKEVSDNATYFEQDAFLDNPELDQELFLTFLIGNHNVRYERKYEDRFKKIFESIKPDMSNAVYVEINRAVMERYNGL